MMLLLIAMTGLLGTIVWYVVAAGRAPAPAGASSGVSARTELGRLLRTEGLHHADAAYVMTATTRVDVSVLSAWAHRHDAHVLAAVVRAGTDEDEMRRHLADDTLPDLAALRRYAADQEVRVVARAARPVVRAEGGSALPEVTAPGMPAADAPVVSMPEPTTASGIPLREMLGDEEELLAPGGTETVAGLTITHPGSWPYGGLEETGRAGRRHVA
ncbi:hypothetical protein [Nocardioides bruguierae]|uniref:Uncharacterized protein n=1 Tax=Nocardioides bruguierae TaxID=2945102 RepID=A0A9X2IER1_9ACTN|nr:hypothetical protein [Nocardioides bruguierae]MCM0618880.1 hypothetical protein [Nocardioides bruguierae]